MDADENSGMVFNIEGEDDVKETWNMREITIILIDATQEMFSKNYFRLCLQCAKTMILNKIISSSKDVFGITFFGTATKDAGEQNPNGIVTFYSLKIPDADIVKQLIKMIDDESYQDFTENFGSSNDYSLDTVLWHCSSLIKRVTSKFNFQRIVLMTCNDNPHKDSIEKQQKVRNKAMDLESLGIKLQLLGLGEEFDGRIFYKEILEIINKDEDSLPKPVVKLEEMVERVNRKDFKKRSVGKLNFDLGNGVVFSVAVYNFYRKVSIKPFTKLDRTTNEPVKCVTTTVNVETGNNMLKSDLCKYSVISNEKITFTHNEIEKISNISKPGITLLGFKSTSYLSPEFHFKSASFIYPSEDRIIGSESLFAALIEACIVKDKFILACYIARYKGRPCYVCLLPQKEKTDAKGNQILPDGFHVIPLPFAENIRDITCPANCQITPQQQELADKITSKLSFKYKVNLFENPKLQTHWANIEALALNYPKPREIFDYTQPDYEEVSNRLSSLEDEFKQLFYDDATKTNKTTSKKRPFNNMPKKTAKYSKLDLEDESFMINIVKEGKIESLTVDILKTYLSTKGLLSTHNMKKIDLINAVYNFLNISNY